MITLYGARKQIQARALLSLEIIRKDAFPTLQQDTTSILTEVMWKAILPARTRCAYYTGPSVKCHPGKFTLTRCPQNKKAKVRVIMGDTDS